MPLPNLLDEPLTLPPRIEPLPNQLTLPELTMATKTADKPKTPRKKVTVKPAPTVDVDRDGMLREAFGKRTLDAMARSLPNSATSGSRSPSKPSSGQPTPSGHGSGTQPPGTKRPLIGRENKKGTR